MKPTFKTFITEAASVEQMMQRMTSELEVIDKDMGNVFVVRDNKMGALTSREHTFDIRIGGEGDVEVHPHDDSDHDRATAIKNLLIVESRDAEKRARLYAIMQADLAKQAEAHKRQNSPEAIARRKAKRQAYKDHYAKLDAEHADKMENDPEYRAAEEEKQARNAASWAAYGERRAAGKHTSKDGWTGD